MVSDSKSASLRVALTGGDWMFWTAAVQAVSAEISDCGWGARRILRAEGSQNTYNKVR